MNIDWSKTSMRAIGAMVANFNHPDGRGKIEFLYSPADRGRYREGPASWEYVHAPEEAALQPWNGEGLPPAGTVCEIKGCMSHYLQWNKVTIFAVRGKTVLFDMEDGRWGQTDSHEIRPLRTPEQVAAEEREKAAMDIVDLIGWDRKSPEAMYAAERLYDAGYRKQVQP